MGSYLKKNMQHNLPSLKRSSSNFKASTHNISYAQFKDTLSCKTEILSRRIYDVLSGQGPDVCTTTVFLDYVWKAYPIGYLFY